MCGLVAVFNKNSHRGFTDEMRDVFQHLLLIDTLRGEDSTGVFMVNRNGDVDLMKEASTGAQFLRTEEWKKMRTAAWNHGAALIGHNRKATRGNVNDGNAHPFVVDDQIVLVHNGGIFGDHKAHADVEVDSHAIAHLLHKHDTVEEALGKFYGAYALIWYDVEDEKVHLIRNKERPLWWMETSDMWVWASEKPMLMFTAARLGLKVKEGPHLVDEDTLNTFSLQNNGGWKVDWRKVEPKRDYSFQQPSKSSEGGSEDTQLFLPWKEQMERVLQERECDEGGSCAQEVSYSQRVPSAILDIPFLSTVGSSEYERTSVFENRMAKSCNKMVTVGEFNTEIASSYPASATVRCRLFEYADDMLGGYYVYGSPLDDPMVIVRHHFSAGTKPPANRIMQMTLNEWIVDITVGPKAWSPFERTNGGIKSENKTEGYCVLISRGLKIIEGGPYKDGERKDSAHA